MHAQSSLTTLSAADRRTRQLGRAMRDLTATHGAATRELLRLEGFSAFEIDTYGDAAAAHARELDGPAREGFTKTDDEWLGIAVEAALGQVGDAAIASAVLQAGVPSPVLGRLWKRFTVRLAASIAVIPCPVAA